VRRLVVLCVVLVLQPFAGAAAQSRTPVDRTGGTVFTTPLPPPSRPADRTGPTSTPDDARRRVPVGLDRGGNFGGRSGFPAFDPMPRGSVLPLPDEPAHEVGELVILWPSPSHADQGIGEIETKFRLKAAERFDLPHLSRVLVVYRLGGTLAAADFKTRLALTRPDWVADYNSRYVLLGEPRLYAPRKLGLEKMEMLSRAVRIGLLDSAVEPIPALRHAALVQQSFLDGRERPAARAHGTAIASILIGEEASAKYQGIARGAELYAAEVVRKDKRETTNVGLLLRGSDWLLGQRVEVVNVSLGGPPNRLLREWMSLLTQRGVVVVAAAGNSGPGAAAVFPAAYAEALAVTATDFNDRVYPQANQGSYVDLSAPGVDVWVPAEGGGRYVSGTSFAAALVTGAVARGLAASEHARDVLALEVALCARALDLGAAGRDPIFGCGLLQAGAASR
jgi:subtilisin family serine protease